MLKETYNSFILQLQNIYSTNEATLITDWLFENILSIKKSAIVQNPSAEINNETLALLNSKLSELLQHKPIQYVLGEAWFYHMKLKVNEHVLIPRPETEELVELIINNEKLIIINSIKILDIGTGSGCIPIALKKNLPEAIVTAIDFSEQALIIAKENATIQNTAVDLLKVNFLNEEEWRQLGQYDIIVSNPPYIPVKEKPTMNRNVIEYEPDSALFVPDNDPLLFYRKIASFGKTHLKEGGKIYLETHEDYAKDTAVLFDQHYQTVEIKKDIFGKERMVIVNQIPKL